MMWKIYKEATSAYLRSISAHNRVELSLVLSFYRLQHIRVLPLTPQLIYARLSFVFLEIFFFLIYIAYKKKYISTHREKEIENWIRRGEKFFASFGSSRKSKNWNFFFQSRLLLAFCSSSQIFSLVLWRILSVCLLLRFQHISFYQFWELNANLKHFYRRVKWKYVRHPEMLMILWLLAHDA